jgi:putative oxidoreductase
MSTAIATHASARPRPAAATGAVTLRHAIVAVGRFLFAAIFLNSAPQHFQAGTIQYAAGAGVPFAGVLVPASGVLALIGALSVLTGYRARLGAWLLVAFLVPVTLAMHAFWNVSDPMMHGIQQVMFLKNVSMLGAALLITQFGAGPWSLDAARNRAEEAR